MKKHWFLAWVLTMAMLLMTGCECRHKEWKEADCTNPKTCVKCGTTEGEPLEHEWVDATCDKPQTCSRCGGKLGEPIGHCWKGATCEAPKTCEVCGATEGDPVGHVWMEATCMAPKTCAVCGATEGESVSHFWSDPTCENPKTCDVCGLTEGEALGHQWSQATLNMPAVCSVCGAIDGTALNYVYAGHGTVKWNETGYIPFYTAESETSEVLTSIPVGTDLRCYFPKTNGWYCTTYNDQCGYIQAIYMNELINENPTDTGHSSSDRLFDLSTIANASIGSKVQFGQFTLNSEFITKKKSPVEWIVLDKSASRMLLLADRSLECLPYSDLKTNTSWETSTLRKWLNNEFINTTFSSQEQRYILSTTLTNAANPNGGTAGNGTTDKVFLLSYDEFFKYVNKTPHATTQITYYALWHRKGALSGMPSAWWLRTPGANAGTACEVGTNGYPVTNYCTDVTERRDVRPAIWVTLQ